MGHQTTPFYSLNRGEVSVLALARVDVERLRLSAATQINFMPRVLGPAMLRPGTAYVTEVRNSLPCRYMPFVFGSTDTALLEFTDSNLRILVNETPISRVAHSTSLGTFTGSAATGTTITVGAGPTIQAYGTLPGTYSTITSTTTVASGDRAKEHALRIVVDAGPITFRIGTTSGGSDIFATTSLNTGTHSLAFTPNAGTIYIQFETTVGQIRYVSAISFEAAGTLTLPSPYTQAMLPSLSYETSADVMFVAGGGVQQRRIERHGARSYSLCYYQSPDGPFPAASGDSATLISPSYYYGNVALTANKPTFSIQHVGSLIRLFHSGQNSERGLAASDTYSDVIRISGVSKTTAAGTTTTTATVDRDFTIEIIGTWVGTLTLQRSLESATSGFTDYLSYTTNTGPTTIKDNLDNIIAWYRVGFKAGAYTSGFPVVRLKYAGGGGAGIARVTQYINSTTVNAEVLKTFTNTTAASDWRMQEWSDAAGYPTAVAIHEGRLWFAGSTKIWGSVSDAYSSFDIDKTGDAGPIDRSIGHGPVQNINWLLPLTRLLLGGDNSIVTARSNSFDEPLTPTVFTLKDSLTVAASSLPAVKVDTAGFFVSQSGRKAHHIFFDVQKTDFTGADLTRLNPDIGIPGFIDIAVQREPDTRIHLVRGDGMVATLLFDQSDQVEAWYRFQTDGVVENVVVLPGTLENRVFYVVKRTINGVTKRYLEKHARIDEAQGATLNKIADCHSIYSGSPTTTITGLSYLEGKAVVVWADGKEVGLDTINPADPATYTVTGGQITLPLAVSNAVVGLPYTAQFQSAKLAYAAQEGTALNQVKRVDHVGVHLAATHALGLKYGSDFSNLDDMPRVEDGDTVDVNTIWPLYDQQMLEFPGLYDTDSRLCLQAQAPRPCTVLGFTIAIKTQG